MTASFEKKPRNTVRRIPDRGTLDKEQVYSILDSGFICHVGFCHVGQLVVIPTLYARSGEQLILHGSAAGRIQRGLVLARSTFHPLDELPFVVLFDTARTIEDREQKLDAMRTLTNWMVPDRWEGLRAPTEQKLRATSVLAVSIEDGSAEIRAGSPKDDAEELLPICAGMLPMHTEFAAPIPDVNNLPGTAPFNLRRVRKYTRSAPQ